MPVDLDKPLSISEFAALFGVTKRFLLDDARSAYPSIPVMKITPRNLRYHPRTIFAEFARRAKVAPETIAASYGNNQPKGETK